MPLRARVKLRASRWYCCAIFLAKRATCLRALRAADLPIERVLFTRERPLLDFLKPFEVMLYLSCNPTPRPPCGGARHRGRLPADQRCPGSAARSRRIASAASKRKRRNEWSGGARG